jgi:hypothetical protein
MLEHLLGEILSVIGQGVVGYFAILAVLMPLLWLLHVVSVPVDRLDRWLKKHVPQRTYTKADYVRGYAVLWSLVAVIGLALHLSIGLR